MSGMGMLAAALQGGMDGYLKGTAYVKGQERDEEDKKFRQERRALMSEQMDRQRKEWAATDAIEGAAAPATVQEKSFAAPTTGPVEESPVVTRFDAAGAQFSDRAQAEEAAKAHNAPLATMTRMRDAAASAGKVDKAQQYGQLVKQLETEGFVDFHRANMPTGVTAEDIKAGKVPEAEVKGLDKFNGLGGFKIPEGSKVRYVVDELGRPDYMVVDKDGKQVTNFTGNTLERMYDYGNYVNGRKERMNWLDKEAENKRADSREAAQERRWREQTDLTREQIGATLKAATMRATAGAAPADAPVWDKEADKTLLTHYTVLDPTTGAKALDGDGLQFGKQVALARARAGGGDTTMAIGYAVAKDAQIRKLAGNDPVKLQQLRAGYLASLTGQGQDAQAPKPAAPATAQQPQPKPGPSIQSVAKPVNDSMSDNPKMVAGITQAIEQLHQVQQFAAAAAKSGDSKATIQWGDKVNAARAQAVDLISKLPKAQQDQLMGSL